MKKPHEEAAKLHASAMLHARRLEDIAQEYDPWWLKALRKVRRFSHGR